MKKILNISLFLILFLFAQFVVAQNITIEEARHIAKNVMFEKANLNQNSFETANEIEGKKDKRVYYYTINLKDNKGFVIISANDKVYPILGYGLKGNSINNDHSPSYIKWMENYIAQIQYMQKSKADQDKDVAKEWNKYKAAFADFKPAENRKAIIGPLFGEDGDANAIKYRQSGSYNDACPGGSIVGCVATALSQILVYHNHPDTAYGYREYVHSVAEGYKNDFGTLSADFGATTYNIASLPNSITSTNDDVAQLCHHAGISVLMDYSTTGSSSSTSDLEHTLITNWDFDINAEYKYRDSYSGANEWENLVRANLDGGMPLIYRGTDDDGDGGHAWVCDGYDDSNDKFHMNWGWGGQDNGFYPLTAMPNTGSYNFVDGHAAIFNITPNTSAIKTLFLEKFDIGGKYTNTSPGWNLDGDGDGTRYGKYTGGYNSSYANLGNRGEIDQWAVSPKTGFPENYTLELSFYGTRLNNLNQSVEIYISTTGTNISSDFTLIESFTVTGSWAKYSTDLSAYKGEKVYLGIKCTGTESGGFTYTYIDDLIVTGIAIPVVCEVDTTLSNVTINSGDNYTYPDGSVGTTIISNTIQWSTITSTVSSCDSVVRTSLSVVCVNDSTTNNVNISSGDNYTYPDGSVGTNITSNTTQYSSLTSVITGCDSIVKTNVSVAIGCDVDTTLHNASINSGDNYTYPDGSVGTAIVSNTIQWSTITSTVSSCDSVVRTSLSVVCVNDSTTNNVTISSGDNYTYPDGSVGTNITSNTTQYSSLTSVITGCDSIVKTNITVVIGCVVDSTINNVTIESGDNYTYPDGSVGTNITSSTTQYSTLTSVATSCDSVVITRISINTGDPLCNANFDYVINQPTKTVSFTDKSVGDFDRHIWNFRVNSKVNHQATSSLQNPVHQYSNPGTYRVRLKIKGNCRKHVNKYIIIN